MEVKSKSKNENLKNEAGSVLFRLVECGIGGVTSKTCRYTNFSCGDFVKK